MTVAITGNTYPVKDQLKVLGGRWNGDRKAWMVPDDKAEQAQALVSGAPSKSFSCDSGAPRGGKCRDCRRPTTGRYSRCYNCSLEYRDGGSRAHGGLSYRDRNGNFVLGDDD